MTDLVPLEELAQDPYHCPALPPIISSVERHPLMTDNNQLHQDFLHDFTELLKKYNAMFEMTEFDPYVCFNYVFDENHNVLREESELQLPDYINPN